MVLLFARGMVFSVLSLSVREGTYTSIVSFSCTLSYLSSIYSPGLSKGIETKFDMLFRASSELCSSKSEFLVSFTMDASTTTSCLLKVVSVALASLFDYALMSELSLDSFLLLNMFISLRMSLETWRLLTSMRFCLY